MSILDIFKKRQKLKEKKVHPVKSSQSEVFAEGEQFNRIKKTKKKEEQAKKESFKEVKPPEIKKQEIKKQGIFKHAYRILKPPHITEKATNLIKENQYVFKVWPRSNKIEVRKAIE